MADPEGLTRTFPDDLNAPPRAPKPRAVPVPAAEDQGTGGGGSAQAVAERPEIAGRRTKATFSIVGDVDDSLEGYMGTDEEPSFNMGRVLASDAPEMLNASSAIYNPGMRTWENVPEELFKSLLKGELGIAKNTIAKWNAGEVGLVQNGLGLALLNGSMSLAEVDARSNEETLKVQLGQQPALAWRGLGKMAADIIRHPLETQARVNKFILDATLHPLDTIEAEAKFVGEAVRFIVGESAEQGPNLREAAKASAAGAVKGAAAGAVAAMAIPVAGVAAVPLGAEIGAMQGALTYFVMNETGSTAIEMRRKGYDLATIRKMAPVAGTIKGVFEMASFGVMTAPFKTAFVKKVLASKEINGILTSAAGVYAKTIGAELGTEELQLLVDITTNNLAAAVENKPELAIDWRTGVDQAVDVGAKTIGATIGIGAFGAGVTALVQRADTQAETKAAAEMMARLEARKREIQDEQAPLGKPSAFQGMVARRETARPVPDLVTAALLASSGPSIDRTITDVKAQAEDVLKREAQARGMEYNDAFITQYRASSHRTLNALAIGPRELTGEERIAWLEKHGEETLEAAMKLHEKMLLVDKAFPEQAGKARNLTYETEKALLEGFKDLPLPAPAPAAMPIAEGVKPPAQQLEEPTELREEGKVSPATFEEKTRRVEAEARVRTLVSDLADVRTLIKEQEQTRERFIRNKMSVRLLDKKITDLIQQEDAIKADITFYEAAGEEALVTPEEMLSLKPATLESIINLGFKEGRKEVLGARRKQILDVVEKLGLTDADLKNILREKNYGMMGDVEFRNWFEEKFKPQARTALRRRLALQDVREVLKEKQLQREQNIRALHELPPLNKMSVEQLRRYVEILAEYDAGDIPLTPARIRALGAGPLAGVKTMGEGRRRAAEITGRPLEDFKNVEIGEFDVNRFDSLLAREGGVKQLLVWMTKTAQVRGEELTAAFNKRVDELAEAAIEPRRKLMGPGERLADVLAPQQARVMEFIEEPDPARQAAIGAALTPEELAWAQFHIKWHLGAEDHMIKTGDLVEGTRFSGRYVFHTGRPIAEMLRDLPDKGIADTARDILTRWIGTTKAMSTKPALMLGLRKHLKQLLFRTGELVPSRNLVLAEKRYAADFYEKVALDETIPTVETMVMAARVLDRSPEAEEMTKAVLSFTKEYLNAKKGNSEWVVQRGGLAENTIRFAMTLTSLKYIAANFALQAAAPIGEQISGFMALGNRALAKAKYRKYTAQGRKVLAKYEAFTGQNPLTQMRQPGRDAGANLNLVMFGTFQFARKMVMEDILLGGMTDAEFKAGEISAERQAGLKITAGRWVDIRGGKSIRGSSVAGAEITQFKGWIVPPMTAIYGDLKALAQTIGSLGKKKLPDEVIFDFLHAAEVTAAALLVRAWLPGDDEDDSFTARTAKYIRREVFTLLSTIDPRNFTGAGVSAELVFRTIRDATHTLIDAVGLLVEIEGHQHKDGKLIGGDALMRDVTPAALKPLFAEEKEK